MATAVLHAQDCLDLHRKNPHHGFVEPVYYGVKNWEHPKKSQSNHNRRRAAGQHAHGSSPQKPCNPKGVPEFQEKKRPLKSGEFHGDSGKGPLKNQNQNQSQSHHQKREQLVTGHVTILKRGQSLESKGHMMERLGVSPPKFATTVGEPSKSSRLARSASGGFKQPEFAEKWAGPAFASSPSPRCLPLPKFPVKKAFSKEEEIDNLATRDLRRLLGLD